jgi:hypothetical protein
VFNFINPIVLYNQWYNHQWVDREPAMSDVEFEEVVELALQLSPAQQARLMEHLAVSVRNSLAINENDADDSDEAPWTPEALQELMRVEPLTGAEIVAAGLTGTWADLDISDGGEWVNEQKRLRKAKRQW